jgi:hypothetical protein
MDECVEFLARICSIPALGPDNQGTGEMEKYLVVRDAVLALGPDRVEEVHAPDGRVPAGVRPNLLVANGRDASNLADTDTLMWSHRSQLWDQTRFSLAENGSPMVVG